MKRTNYRPAMVKCAETSREIKVNQFSVLYMRSATSVFVWVVEGKVLNSETC